MSLVVLDTDVASAMLRRRLPEPTKRHSSALSAVNAEARENVWFVRHWGPRRLTTMGDFIAGLGVLPYDNKVAARWGEIQAYAQQRGRPRPTNASWIAACCLVRDLPLLTFNTKDFEDFAEHEGLVLFGEE